MTERESGSTGCYIVRVFDNFHYMDPDEVYDLKETFKTEEQAVAKAKEIVLESCQEAGFDYAQYTGFGDDPAVITPQGEPPSSFSAWTYAKELCERMRNVPDISSD